MLVKFPQRSQIYPHAGRLYPQIAAGYPQAGESSHVTGEFVHRLHKGLWITTSWVGRPHWGAGTPGSPHRA